MTGIADGMSPDADIPRATSEEERQELFEVLLQTVRIGQLETQQMEAVKDALRKYSKLFITSDQEPAGQIRGIEVEIPTEGPPVACKKRHFNPRALAIMEEINKTMLRKGLTLPLPTFSRQFG